MREAVEANTVMVTARFVAGEWTEPAVELADHVGVDMSSPVFTTKTPAFENVVITSTPNGDPGVVLLERHAQRLSRSASLLDMPDVPTSTFQALLAALLDRYPPQLTQSAPALVQVIAVPFTYVPGSRQPAALLVCKHAGTVPFPEDGGTTATVLDAPRVAPPLNQVKSPAGYAAALPALAHAAELGANDVIFAPGGEVLGSSAANIVLVYRNKLVIADGEGVFDGVTKEVVASAAVANGFATESRSVTLSDLVDAATSPEAEIVLTGSATGITPVAHLVGGTSTVMVECELPLVADVRRWYLAALQRSATLL